MNVEMIKFRSLRGEYYDVAIHNIRPTFFVLSIHKAGSVLLDSVVRDITTTAHVAACDHPIQLFHQGISEEDIDYSNLSVFNNVGVVFYGFRDINNLVHVPSFRSSRKLALVRDPRDIVVSYFFSMMKSHVMPSEERAQNVLIEQRKALSRMSADEYVLQGLADGPLDNMRTYRERILDDPKLRLFKYEDVIFDKRRWVSEIAEELQISLTTEDLNNIADRHDILPSEERPQDHIRQVKPGNYRKHLSKAAIDRLQTNYADLFASFGYPLHSDLPEE